MGANGPCNRTASRLGDCPKVRALNLVTDSDWLPIFGIFGLSANARTQR
jgi:hypothetical protein